VKGKTFKMSPGPAADGSIEKMFLKALKIRRRGQGEREKGAGGDDLGRKGAEAFSSGGGSEGGVTDPRFYVELLIAGRRIPYSGPPRRGGVGGGKPGSLPFHRLREGSGFK